MAPIEATNDEELIQCIYCTCILNLVKQSSSSQGAAKRSTTLIGTHELLFLWSSWSVVLFMTMYAQYCPSTCTHLQNWIVGSSQLLQPGAPLLHVGSPI